LVLGFLIFLIVNEINVLVLALNSIKDLNPLLDLLEEADFEAEVLNIEGWVIRIVSDRLQHKFSSRE
jgi:hypothetical protein